MEEAERSCSKFPFLPHFVSRAALATPKTSPLNAVGKQRYLSRGKPGTWAIMPITMANSWSREAGPSTLLDAAQRPKVGKKGAFGGAPGRLGSHHTWTSTAFGSAGGPAQGLQLPRRVNMATKHNTIHQKWLKMGYNGGHTCCAAAKAGRVAHARGTSVTPASSMPWK
mgnify:CR=1 FL=1